MNERPRTVLVIDDERSMRRNIVDLLSREGTAVVEAANAGEGLIRLHEAGPDLTLLDINLPDTSGLEILKEIRRTYPEMPVIVFTAYGTSERAIEAMKLGAYDYMEKPFDLTEFQLIVHRALAYGALLGEDRQLRSRMEGGSGTEFVDQVVGTSGKMQHVFKLVGRAAPTDATVLIQGESGTGKEIVADAIQRHSLRKDRPFIKVNCGGLPENLLESELFGHEKGAFTGAIARREGRFELASGGTIFLDEVNDMPPALQMKLLRVLQHHTFERVGGKETLTTDIRVLAATNKDIQEEVRLGRFREDLFYRLNVIHIRIPPLRDRLEDIPVLIDHFLHKYGLGQRIVAAEEVMSALRSYAWPGNVRELENVIQRAIVMAQGNVITVDDLPMAFPDAAPTPSTRSEHDQRPLREVLSDVEREMILRALTESDWNQTKAALKLGIHRRLLFSKIRQ